MNKIKDFIKNAIQKDGKSIKIIVAIGLVGILLIALSDMFPDSDKKVKEQSTTDYFQYTDVLENKLTTIISDIEGVGECKVMITLENTYESVYATDNEKKTDNDSLSTKDNYVIYNSDNGEAPVLIKEYTPTIRGVSVVCTGGDNVQVREDIINAVTALFDIPTNRISVSKLK